MRNESPHRDSVNAAPTPSAVDRATFEARMATLRDWEKAHIRQGDALAAARRRLPMVEVDAGLELIGPDGPVTLLDAFDGRSETHRRRPVSPAGLGCGQAKRLAAVVL